MALQASSMKLTCRHLFLRYAGAENPVFQDLSFAMQGPGFHALFGPSGIGKTTLAKLLIGDAQPIEGELDTDPSSTRLYTYNLERLPGWSSVGSHLDKVTPNARRDLKEELIADFGLAKLIGQRFAQLSLGQKNRVNLVRYLLQDFDLMIMDESLANVDELTREKILFKIKLLYPDKFFLYISHNVVEVAKFCRQILVLRGPHKQPQAWLVSGQDHHSAKTAAQSDLEQTMLQIMHAG